MVVALGPVCKVGGICPRGVAHKPLQRLPLVVVHAGDGDPALTHSRGGLFICAGVLGLIRAAIYPMRCQRVIGQIVTHGSGLRAIGCKIQQSRTDEIDANLKLGDIHPLALARSAPRLQCSEHRNGAAYMFSEKVQFSKWRLFGPIGA